jgi:hypothetical protein
MNSFIKRRTIVRKVGLLPMLFIPISVASSALLASAAAFADPISQPLQSKAVKQDDYFHTGAGARYLKRADADLVVEEVPTTPLGLTVPDSLLARADEVIE